MWVIGHRGAAGHVPENTLLSFRRALEMGVDAVELDVHLSASGEVVVIHDDTLDRTTNGTGPVRDKTLAELQALQAGGVGHIPSLAEVLDLIDKRCRVFIEVKADEAALPAAFLIEWYVHKCGWRYDQLILISFHHHLLTDVTRANPNIVTGALFVGIPVHYAQIAADAGASYAMPGIGQCNAPLVEDAKKRGLKTVVWTANTPAQIEKAKALGVDGICSDFPDRVLAGI